MFLITCPVRALLVKSLRTNPAYPRALFEKVAQIQRPFPAAETASALDASTAKIVQIFWFGRENGGSGGLPSFPTDAVPGGKRQTETEYPNNRYHKRPDIRQRRQHDPNGSAQQEGDRFRFVVFQQVALQPSAGGRVNHHASE